MMGEARFQQGAVLASSTGKLWEVIGLSDRGVALLYRFGETPSTAGGWKPLRRSQEELATGWRLTEHKGRHAHDRSLAILDYERRVAHA